MLKHRKEGPPVHAIEGQREPERRYRRGDERRDEEWERRERREPYAACACQVDELPRSERPKELVLYLDELRDLITHLACKYTP